MKILNTFLCLSIIIQLQLLAIEDLTKWDDIANKQSDNKDGARLFAYLYNAQKTYALALSTPEKKIDPISVKILQLFYPDFTPGFTITDNQPDLTNQIATDFKNRYTEEQKQIHAFSIKENDNSWTGKKPYIGIDNPSYKPWFLKKADQFRLNPPPQPTDPFWQKQLEDVKKAMAAVDEEKKQKILYWAGTLFPNSGDLLSIADKYMDEKQIPLGRQLEIRSKLASTLEDASIAAYDSKYTYLVRRPFQLDPNLKTVIPTPNHPSFPAGHAVYSAAAATLLSYYFPENTQEWEKMATECSESRIWAGIHYPIDIEEGKKLGKNIAEYALQQTNP